MYVHRTAAGGSSVLTYCTARYCDRTDIGIDRAAVGCAVAVFFPTDRTATDADHRIGRIDCAAVGYGSVSGHAAAGNPERAGGHINSAAIVRMVPFNAAAVDCDGFTAAVTDCTAFRSAVVADAATADRDCTFGGVNSAAIGSSVVGDGRGVGNRNRATPTVDCAAVSAVDTVFKDRTVSYGKYTFIVDHRTGCTDMIAVQCDASQGKCAAVGEHGSAGKGLFPGDGLCCPTRRGQRHIQILRNNRCIAGGHHIVHQHFDGTGEVRRVCLDPFHGAGYRKELSVADLADGSGRVDQVQLSFRRQVQRDSAVVCDCLILTPYSGRQCIVVVCCFGYNIGSGAESDNLDTASV